MYRPSDAALADSRWRRRIAETTERETVGIVSAGRRSRDCPRCLQSSESPSRQGGSDGPLDMARCRRLPSRVAAVRQSPCTPSGMDEAVIAIASRRDRAASRRRRRPEPFEPPPPPHRGQEQPSKSTARQTVALRHAAHLHRPKASRRKAGAASRREPLSSNCVEARAAFHSR